jgi:hypothetical protein
MAVSAASSRAALLGLALLLVLQHSPAGALGEASSDVANYAPPLQSSTESGQHNQHHHHGVGGGHRGVHSAVAENFPAVSQSHEHRAPRKYVVTPEISEEEEVSSFKKVPRRGGDEITSSASADFSDMKPSTVDRVSGVVSGAVLPPEIIPSSLHASAHMPASNVSGCSTCRFREELRNLSLQAIKEQILIKLGLKHAPNLTGRAIPKIPPIQHLFDTYTMQGDQPPDRFFQPGITLHDEEDDFHAKTTMVVVVAQTCEYKNPLNIDNLPDTFT